MDQTVVILENRVSNPSREVLFAMACIQGDAAVADRIFTASFRPNTARRQLLDVFSFQVRTGTPLLHFIVECDAVQVVYYLLHLMRKYCTGAEDSIVNMCAGKRRNNATPLMLCHSVQVAALLIQCGADVTARNTYNQTPLHYAAARGDVRMVNMLLQCARINVDSRDLRGETPLNFAVRAGFSDTAIQLIRYNANVNNFDANMSTPLIKACMHGQSRLVRHLATYGTVGYKANHYGQTADSILESNGLDDIRDVLVVGRAQNLGKSMEHYGLVSAVYWISLGSSGAIVKFFTLPLIANTEGFIDPIGFSLLQAMNVVLHRIVSRSDPGYVPLNGERLYALRSLTRRCLRCETAVDRSIHCHSCDRCVVNRYNHCIWLGNCIGKKNLGWFLLYLFLFSTNVLFSLIVSILVLYRHSAIPENRLSNYQFIRDMQMNCDEHCIHHFNNAVVVICTIQLLPVISYSVMTIKNYFASSN